MSISKELISQQDAETSKGIINYFGDDSDFLELSRFEGDLISRRDEEDGVKLAAGIQISIERGSLPRDHVAEPYIFIDVLGKTPEEVADIILNDVGEAAHTGSVIVMCGLSGAS
jgi:hypothetical protein